MSGEKNMVEFKCNNIQPQQKCFNSDQLKEALTDLFFRIGCNRCEIVKMSTAMPMCHMMELLSNVNLLRLKCYNA